MICRKPREHFGEFLWFFFSIWKMIEFFYSKSQPLKIVNKFRRKSKLSIIFNLNGSLSIYWPLHLEKQKKRRCKVQRVRLMDWFYSINVFSSWWIDGKKWEKAKRQADDSGSSSILSGFARKKKKTPNTNRAIRVKSSRS